MAIFSPRYRYLQPHLVLPQNVYLQSSLSISTASSCSATQCLPSVLRHRYLQPHLVLSQNGYLQSSLSISTASSCSVTKWLSSVLVIDIYSLILFCHTMSIFSPRYRYLQPHLVLPQNGYLQSSLSISTASSCSATKWLSSVLVIDIYSLILFCHKMAIFSPRYRYLQPHLVLPQNGYLQSSLSISTASSCSATKWLSSVLVIDIYSLILFCHKMAIFSPRYRYLQPHLVLPQNGYLQSSLSISTASSCSATKWLSSVLVIDIYSLILFCPKMAIFSPRYRYLQPHLVLPQNGYLQSSLSISTASSCSDTKWLSSVLVIDIYSLILFCHKMAIFSPRYRYLQPHLVLPQNGYLQSSLSISTASSCSDTQWLSSVLVIDIYSLILFCHKMAIFSPRYRYLQPHLVLPQNGYLQSSLSISTASSCSATKWLSSVLVIDIYSLILFCHKMAIFSPRYRYLQPHLVLPHNGYLQSSLSISTASSCSATQCLSSVLVIDIYSLILFCHKMAIFSPRYRYLQPHLVLPQNGYLQSSLSISTASSCSDTKWLSSVLVIDIYSLILFCHKMSIFSPRYRYLQPHLVLPQNGYLQSSLSISTASSCSDTNLHRYRYLQPHLVLPQNGYLQSSLSISTASSCSATKWLSSVLVIDISASSRSIFRYLQPHIQPHLVLTQTGYLQSSLSISTASSCSATKWLSSVLSPRYRYLQPHLVLPQNGYLQSSLSISTASSCSDTNWLSSVLVIDIYSLILFSKCLSSVLVIDIYSLILFCHKMAIFSPRYRYLQPHLVLPQNGYLQSSLSISTASSCSATKWLSSVLVIDI